MNLNPKSTQLHSDVMSSQSENCDLCLTANAFRKFGQEKSTESLDTKKIWGIKKDEKHKKYR